MKRKLTDVDRAGILSLSAKGAAAVEIGRRLGLDSRSVNGYLMSRNVNPAPAPPATLQPQKRWTQDDAAAAFEKEWRAGKKELIVEFSMNVGNGRKVVVSVYESGGVTLRIGKSKDVAFLVMGAARQLGAKLVELSGWGGIHR